MNTPHIHTDSRKGAAAQAVTPAAGRAWLVVFLLLAFMLINFADKAVLGLAAEPIMHDLHLSPSAYGLLSSSFYFLFSVSAIVVGFVANRVPAKWVLLVLAAVWALTQAPMIGAVGFGVLLASRVVLGAAEGPANPVAMHAAHKWFPNEKRALPSALLNLGAGVGVTLAAPLLTAVIVAYGWHAAFTALLVIGAVWVLVWALLGREGTIAGTGPAPADGRAQAGDGRIAYRRILLSGTWLGGFLANFAAYWALALLTAWIPPYLETALGYSATTTGTLVVLPWAASAVFGLAQGVTTDWLMKRGISSRLARGVLGGTAVLIAGVAMVVFPLVPAGGVQIALLTVAFSLGSITFSIGLTVSAEISPARQRGAVLALSVGIVTTAGLIAPYVTGRIVQAAASPAAGYTLAFVVAGVLLLIGGALSVLFVRPERTARRLGLRA